jgi:hypothetical protein
LNFSSNKIKFLKNNRVRIRGDKPIGGITRVYMEIPQGNSLYSYLYLKQTKMSHFSFYLFSSEKLENRWTEQVLPGRWGVGTSGKWRWRGKRLGG